MTERPILFSAPMVRAILDGRKTQTRRIVKPQPPEWAQFAQPVVGGAAKPRTGWDWTDRDVDSDSLMHWPSYDKPMPCPYGQPGDQLWVRETWAVPHALDGRKPRYVPADARFHYRADEDAGGLLWRPSIHMPRWASRITLEITEVRVERLNAITGMDAKREGVDVPPWIPEDGADLDWAKGTFAGMWESIHGPDSWAANPWVWVIGFKRFTAQA